MTPSFRGAWAVESENERLDTAMEPIITGGLVFVVAHGSWFHALDAPLCEPRWRFAARGPFLPSLADADRFVLGASTDGRFYGLEASSGALALLRATGPTNQRTRIDLPFGHADLSHVQKLGTALEAARREAASDRPAAHSL